MIKIFIRYVISILSYFVYIIFAILKIKSFFHFIKLKNKIIHVVCPGPSAGKFLESKIGESDLIFFINHGVQLGKSLENHSYLFSFTIDGLRSYEIIEYDFLRKNNIKKIFVPHHFFHFKNFKIFSNIDIFLFPIITFDYEYGISINSNSVVDFKKNKFRFSSSGYGTLNSFLQFSWSLSPSEIKIYGCDFGYKNNSKYYLDSMVEYNVEHPFNLMFEEYKILVKKLNTEGIKVELIS